MHSTANAPLVRGPLQILRQVEAWLDARGKWAWIATMVVGFITFVPLGLAILAYMIWGKQMFGQNCRARRQNGNEGLSREGWGRHSGFRSRDTGNQSFDTYKADTLRRLEEEQGAFESFLQRLRDARDKQEFDSFMDDRAAKAKSDIVETRPDDSAEPRRGEY